MFVRLNFVFAHGAMHQQIEGRGRHSARFKLPRDSIFSPKARELSKHHGDHNTSGFRF